MAKNRTSCPIFSLEFAERQTPVYKVSQHVLCGLSGFILFNDEVFSITLSAPPKTSRTYTFWRHPAECGQGV